MKINHLYYILKFPNSYKPVYLIKEGSSFRFISQEYDFIVEKSFPWTKGINTTGLEGYYELLCKVPYET